MDLASDPWSTIAVPYIQKQYQGLPLVVKLFSTFLILLYIHFFVKTRWTRTARYLNRFPGGTIFPFIGNTGLFLGNPRGIQKRFTAHLKKHGKTVRFWKLDQPRIFTFELKVIERLLGPLGVVDKGDEIESFRHFLGNGLVTSCVKRWVVDRKMLKPGFSYKMFDGFFENFNKEAVALMDVLSEKIRDDSEHQNLESIFGRCTMDIVTKSTLGMDLSAQYQDGNLFIRVFDICAVGTKHILFKPWLRLPIIRTLFGNWRAETEVLESAKRILNEVIEHRCATHGQELELNEGKAKPFLDFLIESPFKNDELAMTDHILTFAAAGADSTSRGLNRTLFLLALNPNYQNKAYQEIQKVFETDLNGHVTLSNCTELKYLEMCIKESLRILPPFSWLTRKAIDDVKLDDGRVIPKGCDLLIDVFGIHHDSDIYPNPDIYDPERFSIEGCLKRSPYAFLSFGAGSRNCIASKYAMLELKVLLVHILQKYTVHTNQKWEEMTFTPGMLTEVHPAIELCLKLR